jgi:hypothetical protein
MLDEVLQKIIMPSMANEDFEISFREYYANIPAYLQDQLTDWVRDGIPPSSDWLRAVIKNDLRYAVKAADAEQKLQLERVLDWLWNCSGVPGGCHGSIENYHDWRLKKAAEKKASS